MVGDRNAAKHRPRARAASHAVTWPQMSAVLRLGKWSGTVLGDRLRSAQTGGVFGRESQQDLMMNSV